MLNALPTTLAGEVLKDPCGHFVFAALEAWVLPCSLPPSEGFASSSAGLRMEMLVLTSVRNTRLPGLWLLTLSCIIPKSGFSFWYACGVRLSFTGHFRALKIGLILGLNVWVIIFLWCTSPCYGLVDSGSCTWQLHQRTEVKWKDVT